MRFDWKPESKDRYFRKAEAAVKAAGFDDILRVDRDQFSIVKGTVKVHFKPISRDGKTRRWWEAKRTIENMHEVPPAKDQFGRKHKSIFIHAFMILEMEEQDERKHTDRNIRTLHKSGTYCGTSCNGSHGCSRSRIADTFVCSANIMTHADRRTKANEHEICNEK